MRVWEFETLTAVRVWEFETPNQRKQGLEIRDARETIEADLASHLAMPLAVGPGLLLALRPHSGQCTSI